MGTLGIFGERPLRGRGDVAAARGDRARAIALLDDAITALDATETHLYGCAARWRLAGLVADERADALRTEAIAYLVQQGVVAPERFLSLYCP